MSENEATTIASDVGRYISPSLCKFIRIQPLFKPSLKEYDQ